MAFTFAMPVNTFFWKKNLNFCISPVLEDVFCKNSLLEMTKTSHRSIRAPYQKNKQINKKQATDRTGIAKAINICRTEICSRLC